MVSKEFQLGTTVAVTLGVAVLLFIVWKSFKKNKRKDSEHKSENEQDVPALHVSPISKPTTIDESKPDTVEAGKKLSNDEPEMLSVSTDKTKSLETRKSSDQSSESNGENEPFVTLEKPKEGQFEEDVSQSMDSASFQKISSSDATEIEQSASSADTALSHPRPTTPDTAPSDSSVVESPISTGREDLSSTETSTADIQKEKEAEPVPVPVVHEELKSEHTASALESVKDVTPATDENVVPDDDGAGEAMTPSMDISLLDDAETAFVINSDDGEVGAGDTVADSLQIHEGDTSSASFSEISMPSFDQVSLEQNVSPISSTVASENNNTSSGESGAGTKESKKESETLPKDSSLDGKEDNYTIGDTKKINLQTVATDTEKSFEEIKPQESKLDAELQVPKLDQESSNNKPDVKSDVKDSIEYETKVDSEVIIKAIQQAQSSPQSVDKKTIEILVNLLQVRDEKLVQTALDCIVRCAAFSVNQKALGEYQCPAELFRLLESHSLKASSGVQTSDSFLVSVNNAIMNLSMDISNQKQLEGCIPVLIDLVMNEGMSSDIQLSCLQPLTNLATTNEYHGEYTRAIQQLYLLLDSENRAIRIQALKLLVNLSINPDMVKHLLAAKAPNCLLNLLDKAADATLTLRMATFLANVVTTVSKEEMTSESLPTGDKAASPEMMFTAIFGVNNIGTLRNKVYSLTRHDSEDISQQAAKLYGALPK